MRRPDNQEIADQLDRIADLLEAQEANPHRVRAYRRAAGTLRHLPHPAADLLAEQGHAGLIALPTIGEQLAGVIEEYVLTGRTALLERLEGEVSPEALLTTVPGLGDELAGRIHRQLGVESLEALEIAAHDGRLAQVPGMGPRRLELVRAAVGEMLRRAGRDRGRRARAAREVFGAEGPPVDLLLEIDRLYREAADAGRLETIVPRRFNPDRRVRLPIMSLVREGWHLTALWSNTARAHELGRTRDWVVIYYDRDGREDQCTVVTEWSGPLRGLRVVRGRELESAHFHGAGPELPTPPAPEEGRQPGSSPA